MVLGDILYHVILHRSFTFGVLLWFFTKPDYINSDSWIVFFFTKIYLMQGQISYYLANGYINMMKRCGKFYFIV